MELNTSDMIGFTVLAMLVICFIAVVISLVVAPEGYEDETGFNYGKEPKRPADEKVNGGEPQE